MENNKMEIIIEAVDKATRELDKIKGSLANVEKQAEQGSTSIINGIKGQIQPFNDVIRILGRVGVMWGVSFGLMMKAVIDINKEISDLDKLSIKTGISASDLSKRIHGFDITTQGARVGAASMTNFLGELGDALTMVKLKTTEATGEIGIMKERTNWGRTLGALMTGGAPVFTMTDKSRDTAIKSIMEESEARKKNSKEYKALLMVESDLYDRLSMSKVEYTKKQFDDQLDLMKTYQIDTDQLRMAFEQDQAQKEWMQELSLQSQILEIRGQTTEALRLQQEVDYQNFVSVNNKKIDAFRLLQKEMLKKEAFNEMLKTLGGISSALGTLDSALQQAAKNNKAYAEAARVTSYGMAIVNTAQGITKAYATYDFLLATVFASMIAAAGAVQIATIASTPLAEGGIVTSPTHALIGEAGPEAVIPLKNYGGRIGSVINNIEINYPTVRSQEDIDELTEQISMKLAREVNRI